MPEREPDYEAAWTRHQELMERLGVLEVVRILEAYEAVPECGAEWPALPRLRCTRPAGHDGEHGGKLDPETVVTWAAAGA